jgi:drug/metabolite transporter (DMT)-like permease
MSSFFKKCINTSDNQLTFGIIIFSLIFAFLIYRLQINPGKPLTIKQTHDLLKNIGTMIFNIGLAMYGTYYLIANITKCYNEKKTT